MDKNTGGAAFETELERELYDALEEAIIVLEMVHRMNDMEDTEELTHLKSVRAKAREERI